MYCKRVLIIEDSASLVYVLQRFLKDIGLQSEFAYNGKEGIKKSLLDNIDLILLDIGLPDINGQDILRKIRLFDRNKPVIIISNNSSIENEIDSYRNGATIFHRKPISFELLKAQILNSLGEKGKDNIMVLKEYEIDVEGRRITKNGKYIPLTPNEMNVMLLLIKSRGYVCTREQILSTLNPYVATKKSNCVDTIICRIRKKLMEDKDNGIIRSVNGVGYRISEAFIKV